MGKVIHQKFDKKLIPSMPRAVFTGRIEVVLNEFEAEKAVDYLLSRPIVGVDTETRPAFRRGVWHKVALLQACDGEICFLFRLNVIGMPPAIIRFLEDTTVLKVGLSWHDDLLMLHKRAEFNAGRFVDLQNLVGGLGIKDLSLQKLYANIFGMKISKREQLSNWESDVLSEKQKLYAATDAWTCVMLYNEMKRLHDTGDYELIEEENIETISSNEIQADILKER